MTTYHVAAGGDNLNLRSQPDIQSAVIGEIPSGTDVELLQPNPQNGWFNVSVTLKGNLMKGWAASEYLLPGSAGSASAQQFTTWRLGMNLPGIAFYGTGGDPLDKLNEQVWNDQLDTLTDLGVKTIRFFVRHEASADYLERVSKRLNQLPDGMSAVLCLMDSYDVSGFILPEDKAYYDIPGQGTNLLNKRYFADIVSGANTNYLTYVRKVVEGLSEQQSKILFWEIGNELKLVLPNMNTTQADGDTFLSFVRKTVDVIHKASGNQGLVSAGLINSKSVIPNDRSYSREVFTKMLYNELDAVSLHYYREYPSHGGMETDQDLDISIARTLNKPTYLGELGADIKFGARNQFYQEQIAKSKNKDSFVFMVMPWDLGSLFSPSIGADSGIAWNDSDHGAILQVLKAAAKA